ncbi:MAG: autotransporter assembly complex protein TamA [Desulfocapsa sp.]|nr:autotransporter assembly complex protein TamA [Desulfocapsa sp.]
MIHICRQLQLAFTATLLFLFFFPLSSAAISLDVEIIGLDEHLEKNALNFLGIEKRKNDQDLTIRGMKRLHEQAPDEIREALQPFGYYLPVIQSELSQTKGEEPKTTIKGALKTTTGKIKDTLSLLSTGNIIDTLLPSKRGTGEEWWATYRVDKGPPVEVTKRDIQWAGEGASNPAFQQNIKEYLDQAGTELVHSDYEAAKINFLNHALSLGYPKAKITTSEVVVDLETNSAEMTIHMDTGPLYYFGDVRFIQDFLDPDLLQHYITLNRGEPYSYEALLEFQQNLIGSNYAREVTIQPLFNEAVDQQVPLDVLLKPIAPHKFSFGIGYETDVGVRGSALWTDRLVNRHGHHSEVYFKLSPIEGTMRGQYFIPVLRPLTDRWVSTASYEYEETPSTDSNTLGLETAFVRRNIEDTRFYKGFILASSETFNVDLNPRQTTNLLSLGGTARSSVMEEEMFPQQGHYLFGDLRGGLEALLSDTSYGRLHLKGKYLLGFGENGRIATRLEIGTTWVDNFDLYPTSLRFFAGGDSSIRGYTYESLGPVNDEGIVMGGKHVLTYSFEYDHRVTESWVLAGFVDAGNAYDDELTHTYVGAGVGFRWLAPFGSLRIDLAWPLSEQPDIGDYHFHLGFGATL